MSKSLKTLQVDKYKRVCYQGMGLKSQVLQDTRFRAGFVYNMGDEEASKDAAAAALAVLDAGRSSSDSRGPGGGVGLRTAT